MSNSYEHDYIIIALVLIISLLGIVQVLRHSKEPLDYKYAVIFLLGGVLVVIISTVANSFFEHNWESKYIMDFLFLKRVSKDWFFRHLCSWGYIFLSWGLSMFIVTTIRKSTIIINMKRTNNDDSL